MSRANDEAQVQRHAFKTTAGLPPDTNQRPVCGARLDPDWAVLVTSPVCPKCAAVVARLDEESLEPVASAS